MTTGVPVTTADVTGATTVRCVPYKGNQIALYNGTNWNVRASAEFSLALGTLISGRPYDVFCYDNAGVPTLEFTAWTNDTTRATALAYQDGVLVKSGALTRRYLGTFYTTSTTTTEDSKLKRLLFNYYNDVLRDVAVQYPSNHTYSTAAFRQWGGTNAAQVEVMTGVSEKLIDLTATAVYGSNAAANAICYTGIGVNSTTVDSATVNMPAATFAAPTNFSSPFAKYTKIAPLGRNVYAGLQYGAGANTQTWYGASAPAQTGMVGGVFA